MTVKGKLNQSINQCLFIFKSTKSDFPIDEGCYSSHTGTINKAHSPVLQEGAIPTAFAFASAVLPGNRAAGKGE